MAVFFPAMPDANSSKPANFLESLSNMGMELQRKAQEAGDEHRRHMASIRRNAPSMRLTPRPANNLGWADEPQAHSDIQSLERNGFVREAACEFAELPRIAIIHFLHPSRGIIASLSHTPKGTIIDLESRHADGTIFNFTNAPVAKGIAHPAWFVRRHIPGAGLEAVLKRFDAEKPQSSLTPAQRGDSQRWTMDGYQKIQLWRADRGGWEREEIRRQRGWEPTDDTDERLEQLEFVRHENLERWLYNWLRSQPDLPFDPTALADSLAIISDAHDDAMALAVWTSATKDVEIGRGRFESGRPRAEFAELNAERGHPLRLVCQKSTPPAADFYQPQERPRVIASDTPLGNALNLGLLRGDLRRSLLSVTGQEIESEADARSLIEALSQLAGSLAQNRARDVQAVARMFGFARNQESDAARILRTDGTPVLAALYDQVLAEDGTEESGEAVLGVLKVLATLDPPGTLARVFEAIRRPLAPAGTAWTAILATLARETRTRDALLDGLSNPLPISPMDMALLLAANGAAASGEPLRHPFNLPAGRALLESWITSSDPDDASKASAAVDALPYLADCESLYSKALAHPNVDVRLGAAWQIAAAGRPDGLDALVDACGHWATAALARGILVKIQRADAIPAAAQAPDFIALSEMAAWLAHPSELGRMPDELEIVDHRTLTWPPEREKKPVWLIRFRIRSIEEGEPDQEGWGLTGTVTFCLFSYELHKGTIDEAYAIHCAWEMEQAGLVEAESIEDESDAHQDLLDQWTGALEASARVVLVMRPSEQLGISTDPVALARVGDEDSVDPDWLVLDGPRSRRVPADQARDEPSLALLHHLGLRLLGMA